MSLASGLFLCEGKYSSDCCQYNASHSINPYQSYEVIINSIN